MNPGALGFSWELVLTNSPSDPFRCQGYGVRSQWIRLVLAHDDCLDCYLMCWEDNAMNSLLFLSLVALSHRTV